MAKPGLAILIGKAMDKNKGKESDKEPDPAMGDDSEYESDEEMDNQMQQIAEELIDAVHSKDAGAVKDLLKEAFECMSS